MVLLLGHSEDGRGQWEREGSSAGLWNECVPEKNYSWRKGSLLVYDPTFYHLCFSEPWIRMFFQVSGVFFRNPAENFAGLRSGTFFRPKEDPGMWLACFLTCAGPSTLARFSVAVC